MGQCAQFPGIATAAARAIPGNCALPAGLRTAYHSVGLSALPLGMISLAIVLNAQQWPGSLLLAGWLSGTFTLANAAGLVAQGRLLDRFGAVPVVRAGAVVSAVGLTIVVLAGTHGITHAPVLAAAVALGGLGVPAITTAVRGRLPRVVHDPALRTAGYAQLSVQFQVAVTVGPLLVSVGLVVGAPWSGLVAATVLLVAAGTLATGRGTLLGDAGTASRDARAASTPTRSPRWWTGPFLGVLTVAASPPRRTEQRRSPCRA